MSLLSLIMICSLIALSMGHDFGMIVDRMVKKKSLNLTGLNYLDEPAPVSNYVPREHADAMDRFKLSNGLNVEYVSRNVAQNAGKMKLYPDDSNYTHILVCVSSDRSEMGNNPSVQRVNVMTGAVETILFGMKVCGGIEITAWGSVLVTERTTDGSAYEIFSPSTTTNHWISDRTSGVIMTTINGNVLSPTVFKRNALPSMKWKGIAILSSGVVYGGEDFVPGSDNLNTNGGSIFKYVPNKPFRSIGRLDKLSESPLAGGRTFAMTTSCVDPSSSSFPQYGQGCEVGSVAFVQVDPHTARQTARSNYATGYNGPKDVRLDPLFNGTGVRWCFSNSGTRGSPGTVVCVEEQTPVGNDLWLDYRTGLRYQSVDGVSPTSGYSYVFVTSGRRLNSFNDLSFNSVTGMLFVTKQGQFGEVGICMTDGKDDDYQTDMCAPFLSVADPQAEVAGFVTDSSELVGYMNIQHGECTNSLKDFSSNPVGGCTDDLIKVSGLRLPICHTMLAAL